MFYADEYGDTSLALDPGSTEPALKAGTSEYFILAAVGVRDASRRPLAESLVALKKKHFGADVFDRDWETSEIKGRLLNHAMVHALDGRTMHAPSAYRALDSLEKTTSFIDDIGLIFRRFRPTILLQIINKKKMLNRELKAEPLGVAYAYIHQRIARIVEQNYSGESAMIVADEQKEHEKYFTSGGLTRARDSLTENWSSRPNFNVVLDKPLWIDPKYSTWDKEIIQLADIAAFSAARTMTDGRSPEGRQYLWEEIRACLATNERSGSIYEGFAIYPAPKKSELPHL
ncbi:MAG: DUF3800 domain-containing protein [Glaciihabitans sp.]